MLSTSITFLVLVGIAAGAVIPAADRPSSGRIVGGNTAQPGQFPYQVSLRYSSGEHLHFCGGAIIRPNWILTAANCVAYRTPESIVVITGAHYTLENGEPYPEESGTIHEVDHIELHDEYDYEHLTNDIALVRTATEIEFTRYVHDISIGVGEHVPAGVSVRASGWGTIYFGGPMPEALQYLDLTTLTNIDCKARHAEGLNTLIHDSTLCAYSSYYEQGICLGDTGGPLVQDDVLVGIASWEYPCGTGKPDGFTRVSSFLPWILEHLNETVTTEAPEETKPYKLF